MRFPKNIRLPEVNKPIGVLLEEIRTARTVVPKIEPNYAPMKGEFHCDWESQTYDPLADIKAFREKVENPPKIEPHVFVHDEEDKHRLISACITQALSNTNLNRAAYEYQQSIDLWDRVAVDSGVPKGKAFMKNLNDPDGIKKYLTDIFPTQPQFL